ncbi:N-acetyltransferase B complex non catalytic subunit-domain-containing protein [Aspergillus granulosus]|uniref:N-acetyltransferase B complex non catalytic subunit-domain-containing protein n=1 Tax=Aspergillus granulosus TaxID=176169 RepID=A0ABR4H3V3_9EURO
MSTNDAVFHRRNKQIEDAIDVGNLKQALQLIEKRIKKGEDTPFLKAWKAHILHRHADDAHQQRGITETLALCKAEPAVTDLDTLEILYETLQRMGGHEDTMRSIWERAAKAKPQDLDIQTRWFEYAFEKDDWKSAQKATMSLQNNFPKKRNYYIWAIFLSYLLAVDEGSSEMDRKLFGTLAYRMVSKAAESVPADPKELLSPPRALQSAEELLLLTKIYESQGRHSEIVKILDSENLGLKSKMVQNDWSFIGVKLSSLEKAEMWTEALAYTKELLAIPSTEEEKKSIQERDDWAVWHLLLTATQKLESTETTLETQKFISEFIAAQPKSRNAQLAHLDLTHSAFQSGSVTQEVLLSACQAYYDHSKSKLYCFSDLLGYLPSLNKDALLEFVDHASKVSEQSEGAGPFKGVAAINALKVEYCFLMSSNAENVSRDKVEDFVSRCLKAYREAERPDQSGAPSTIESQPSDDLCVLAAMGLIRFSNSWTSSKQDIPDIMLIRAAAILERLIVDSPHNYQGLLLLVRLYLCLGAGSIALKAFSKLSVKQLQFETVAHNLFTRLSTIHPHSAPPIDGAEYKDFNPQSAFVQALNFYRSADLTSTRQRSKGLDYGSYVNIEGTIELQKRLRQSVCRRMWALQVKQTQRLAGGDPMGRFDDMARDPSPLIDQRTFDAFMNCEAPGQPTFEELVRLGPLPQDRWVRSAQMTDKLFGLLKDLSNQKPIPVAPEVPSLDDFVGASTAESDMTPSEIESTKTNLSLFRLAVYLSGSKSVTPEQVDESLNQVEEWLNSKSKALEIDGRGVSPLVSETAIFLQSGTPYAPTWRFFHAVYSTLDSVKAAASLFSIASKKGSKNSKLPKDRATSLLDTARKVHQSAQANARALKKHISESGKLGSLIDLVMTSSGTGEDGAQLRGELEKTLDTSSLELFCGELMESWDEALGGVLAVRL